MFGFQKRPLFLFDADAGGNSGGGAGRNSGGSNGGTGEGDKPKQEEKKSYTQAELDAMFADRAKQGASSAVASLLKKLGYEKPEDLEAVVSEGKKSLDEKKTEADKAAEALAKLAKERDEAKTTADAAIAKATERVMRFSRRARNRIFDPRRSRMCGCWWTERRSPRMAIPSRVSKRRSRPWQRPNPSGSWTPKSQPAALPLLNGRVDQAAGKRSRMGPKKARPRGRP